MVALMIKDKALQKIILLLVALSTGALMGGAFIHLIPEAIEEYPGTPVHDYVLIGFLMFFLIEKFLYWRHCHKGKCDVHTFAYMNLVGEAIHNFIDGLIIGTTFLVSIELGLITTFAIALHEIPQEIGDFGVLVHGGYKKKKALILNYLIATTVILGGVMGYYLSNIVESLIPLIIPIAAGGFIYIAASDLMPELRKETKLKKSLSSIALFIIGLLLMYLVKL